MSLRDVLNAMNLLLGMPFVDLSRMKWTVSKIGQKYFLFLADLAKFTKNARNTVECYPRERRYTITICQSLPISLPC